MNSIFVFHFGTTTLYKTILKTVHPFVGYFSFGPKLLQHFPASIYCLQHIPFWLGSRRSWKMQLLLHEYLNGNSVEIILKNFELCDDNSFILG